ncbi:MAG TPA: lysylphosphatidylglycerol synthase transmembrane domain-containing protein [Kofleriaceae bacterium]|nr:lysylphosphatidylglycerol synthase transmembrane domain-containing protein [Kofleriaceae bacterium]
MFGTAAVVALVVGVVESSQVVAFARIVEHARPWWVALGCVLQLGTYVVQGEVWRVVGRRSGTRLSIVAATELSLVKLFIDQALPSGGLSGAVTIAQALQNRGMTEAAAIATVVIDTVTYYLAFLIALAAAMLLAAGAGHASLLIAAAAIAVAAFAIAAVVTILRLADGRPPTVRVLQRAGFVRRTFDIVRKADRALVHDRHTRRAATMLQLGIIVLDAATVVVLVHAMGSGVSLAGVFASYMISSVFRTLGILPGGLGSFEAASVLTLRAIGVPTAAALSATLIYRGLSFWLPMVPGFVASRHILGRASRMHRLRGSGCTRPVPARKRGHASCFPP